MKKKLAVFIAVIAAVQALTMPVSAVHVGHASNEPTEDPYFIEQSLEDFLNANPDYVGVPEQVSTLTEIETTEGSYTWKQVGSRWQLFDPNGNQVINDWFKDYNGNWYYIGADGYMKTGWLQYGIYWYYLNGAGVMQVDWYQVGGEWYYLRTESIAAECGGPEGGAVWGAWYLPETVGSNNRTRNYYFDYNCAMQDWTYPLPTSYVTCSSCFNDPRGGPDQNHQGIDVPAPNGTTVKSCTNGTVIWAGYNSSMGNYAIVESNVKDSNGKYLRLRYQHFNSPASVTGGNSVSAGQTIGYVGTTGSSTGNHLHLDVNDQGLPLSESNLTVYARHCINPSSFFTSITLLQGSLADVPPYGADYCYAR